MGEGSEWHDAVYGAARTRHAYTRSVCERVYAGDMAVIARSATASPERHDGANAAAAMSDTAAVLRGAHARFICQAAARVTCAAHAPVVAASAASPAAAPSRRGVVAAAAPPPRRRLTFAAMSRYAFFVLLPRRAAPRAMSI